MNADLLSASEMSLQKANTELEELTKEFFKANRVASEISAQLIDKQIEVDQIEAVINVLNGITPTAPAMEPEPGPLPKKDKKKGRKKDSDNPYANISCNGCGRKGSMRDVVKQTSSGKSYRTLSCSGCGTISM